MEGVRMMNRGMVVSHVGALFVGVCILALLPVVGWAGTINVPDDYETIQEAIDHAETGDEVVVAPGDYTDNLDFKGKAITVRSTDPTDPDVVWYTTIDGDLSGPVVTFQSGETSASQLLGFYLSGGLAAEGSGVLCDGASPTVSYNQFCGNGDVTGRGGAIYCRASDAVITYNEIYSNDALDGGGIYCESSSPTISHNDMYCNNAATGHGGGIYCDALSAPMICDNDIWCNLVYGGGGGAGIYCDACSPTILHNEIAGNETHDGYGGGICCEDGAAPAITNSSIDDNWAVQGGGIYCHASGPTVSDCTFSGNHASGSGGGIYCVGDPSPQITRSSMIYDNADGNGGAIFATSCSPAIRNCLIAWAYANQGAGVYLQDSGPGTLIANATLVLNECLDTVAQTGTIHCNGGSSTLRDSIVTDTIDGSGVYVEGGHAITVAYCDVYLNEDGNYVGLTDPTGTNGNLSVDPCYGDYSQDDYHLKSIVGRWDGSAWVTDSVHSPCIDAGDPASGYANEPAPNGGRANMGAYGNTAYASKSIPPPSLQWAGTTGYETDGVDPDTGDPNSTTFTFKVRYTDLTGHAPRRARCLIQRRPPEGSWEACRSLALTQESGDIASGAIYSGSMTLPNLVLKCRFLFRDASGAEVSGEPAGFAQGPMIVARPSLCWTGATGFETDGVDPEAGPLGTNFRFQVRYGDSAGDEPTTAKVVVRRNGRIFRQKTMSAAPAGDLRLGKVFRTSVTLTKPGTYEYRFSFADDSGNALGPPNNWTDGPTITGSGSGMVASLAVAPSRAGAQVTFSLAGAANVTATVLNVAGRPIKTLVAEKSLGAGLQTLLWDRRAETGLSAPAGLYLIRVKARDARGGQSTALAVVALR
jgi:predicted outer membrane repeat protein